MLKLSTLVGRRILSVKKIDHHTWRFVFASDISISTQSLWRFIHTGRIQVTSDNHGHQFGLPQPVDAANIVTSKLQDSKVISVRIDETTGDLFVVFSNEAYLQFLQTSCGYESWDLFVQGDRYICLGGGGVTAVSEREEDS